MSLLLQILLLLLLLVIIIIMHVNDLSFYLPDVMPMDIFPVGH